MDYWPHLLGVQVDQRRLDLLGGQQHPTIRSEPKPLWVYSISPGDSQHLSKSQAYQGDMAVDLKDYAAVCISGLWAKLFKTHCSGFQRKTQQSNVFKIVAKMKTHKAEASTGTTVQRMRSTNMLFCCMSSGSWSHFTCNNNEWYSPHHFSFWSFLTNYTLKMKRLCF